MWDGFKTGDFGQGIVGGASVERLDGNVTVRALYCTVLYNYVPYLMWASHAACATEVPPCSPPSVPATVPARSREGCTVDNRSAAQPENASCSWCPEPCSMPRIFSCVV